MVLRTRNLLTGEVVANLGYILSGQSKLDNRSGSLRSLSGKRPQIYLHISCQAI